mmetsp:Transcript_63429/g.151338  ORF Transcript_63429/g.151338 Transcript_63429/m.151338 type:complete len:128 (+) Transcript_63429:93-476(+)
MMLGLLRTAMRVSRPLAGATMVSTATPTTLAKAPRSCYLFVPVDWWFRFFPYFARDRVRFLIRWIQLSFLSGFGFVYLWAHTPFAGAEYDHIPTWPLFRYIERKLDRTGELEYNLKIKVHHFYPQEE